MQYDSSSKISILLPVFNAAPFLQECLDSILNQVESNWELIAIDDFSTDPSLQILKENSRKDNRIRIFQNTEKGIIPALRLAFENSSGQLITRMDADDKMTPSKLTVLKENLLKNGKGHLATGCVAYFSATTLGQGYLKYANWLNGLTRLNANFSEIYKECVIPSPCWMVFREDLLECGAFQSNTYPEDYDLCFRFYKKGLNVVGSEEVLHLWRDHSNRSSRTMEVYADNQYFELKIPYFLSLDYNDSHPLVLWGAGKKGKKIAQLLIKHQVDFHWVCDTPNKWGVNIYGKFLEKTDRIQSLQEAQILVAVAAVDGQKEIKQKLKKVEATVYFLV